MGISIFSNSGIKAYNLKNYIVDTVDDIANLPTGSHPGSTAFVVATSEYYMLNNQKKWKKVILSSGSGGTSSASDEIWDGGTPIGG